MKKWLFTVLLTALLTSLMAAGALAEDVYTVTLLANNGTETSVVYSTANGDFANSWQTALNGQFYYDEYYGGALSFRLDDDFRPDEFTVPTGYLFDGWEGNARFNILTTPNTVFKAKWKADPNYVTASASFSAAEVALAGPGFTDVEITCEELVLGKYMYGEQYSIAKCACLSFFNGELKDGDGNAIGFSVYSAKHEQTYNNWPEPLNFFAQGEKGTVAVYIDPVDFALAAPGTYTGALEYSLCWEEDGLLIGAETYPIALTLTVPPAFETADFTLPAALTAINEGAFEGDEGIKVVDASSCKSIGKNAFKGCSGLRQIHLPKNCLLDATTFTDCGTVYVFAPAGGTTQQSCAAIANCEFVIH